MAAKNKYTLQQKLQNLRCSFNLQINNLTQRKATTLVLKFKREYECDEYDHPEEKKRYYNLITYLNYVLRNVEEAKQCNKMALEIDPESIVALGNQAWMSHREHNHSDDFKSVEDILRKVDDLCTDRVKSTVANSEIAYSYARFGLPYYASAESMYEEVLKDVDGLDKQPVFLWQYGCGLIKNRFLRQKAIRGDTKYDDTIKSAASLLSKVAEQNKNLRFKARALTELGNLVVLIESTGEMRAKFGIVETANEMFSRAMNILSENEILDIPVLEQYAYHCKIQNNADLSKYILFKTIKVKKSSRAFALLARIRKEEMTRKLKSKFIPDNDESREILRLFDCAIADNNVAALGYRGQFLMQMGKCKEAIAVFEKVYRSLELADTQDEALNWKTKVLCETCHAKCLSRSPSDDESIIRAKGLLWSAIELCCDVKMESQKPNENLKHAVNTMLKLIQGERNTSESVLVEIAMLELVGKKEQAEMLRKQMDIMKISTVQQPELAQTLIKIRQFNEGLFLLNKMWVSNTLPEEKKEFAIEAHLEGAQYALEKGDAILARRRALFAFDIRFANDNGSNTLERLHIFLLANQCNQEKTQSIQKCLTNLTNLNITSCFDAMPGNLRFSSLEENMLQSPVLAILFDDNDMKKDDWDSRFFRISVEIAQFVHITHEKEKALMVITVSDHSGIPDRLRYLPHLSLGTLFEEDKQKWIHTFYQRALLK